MFELNGHMPDEYYCYHIHTEIAPPEPRREMLEIPLRDGALNVTAMLSDMVHYSTREITLGLESTALREEWPLIQSALMRDFHGQAVQLVLDNDPDYYWEGWAAVDQMEDKGGSAGWTIRIQAQPLKKTRAERDIPGPERAPFICTIEINGLRGYPTFQTTMANTTVQYNGTTYPIPPSTSFQEIYGLSLVHGTNELLFAMTTPGTGVKIKVREGTL